MQFTDNKSIYLQICDYIMEKILTKNWQVENKIPSVRELAVELEVNPNTVAKSYEQLTNWEIIFSQRGLGYYVHQKAISNTKKIIKLEFFDSVLPKVFTQMYLLDIDIKDIEIKYNNYLKKL